MADMPMMRSASSFVGLCTWQNKRGENEEQDKVMSLSAMDSVYGGEGDVMDHSKEV